MDSEGVVENKKKVFSHIIDLERDSANTLLDMLAEKSNHQDVIETYLEPVLAEIGDLWLREEVTLAQGYVAGKIAEDFMEKAIESGEFNSKIMKSRPPVIIGNIEDDFHSFGRKMVSTFLKISGWEVIDLGNDVTAEEFVQKAIETNACIIAASAMMYSTAGNMKNLRNEIDSKGLKNKIMMAVGGAVFKLRPELVEEVGGDGTADSAINAPKLFNNLYETLVQRQNNE